MIIPIAPPPATPAEASAAPSVVCGAAVASGGPNALNKNSICFTSSLN
jgi:hypothetical protein